MGGGANQDGNGYGGVFARRFTSSGTPLGTEFQVNTYTPGGQRAPTVAVADDGRFVVAWESDDGAGYGVFARRFDTAGAPVGSQFQVNVYTYAAQRRASIVMENSGDFIVVWDSERQDYAVSGLGVFGRRYDSAGNALAVEFQVNTFTTGNQYEPRVAADDDGDFVVVWWSFGQDGNQRGVFGRRFDSSGSPLASEFLTNTYTSGFQDEAAVAMDGDGDFVVSFEGGTNSDGSSEGIFARRFDSTGAALGSQFQVNVITANAQLAPRVGMDGDGDFIVTWQSQYQDGSGFGIFARRFGSDGVAQTADFQVNTYTQLGQYAPDVAASADGDFLVAWDATNHDGNSSGIFARRYLVLTFATLDADASVGALTDGLLALRFLFGFTGATLVNGAVSGSCTVRCDATSIFN